MNSLIFQYIVSGSLLSIAIVSFLWTWHKKRFSAAKFHSKVEAITNEYKSEINRYKAEIKRQNYVIADYQKRFINNIPLKGEEIQTNAIEQPQNSDLTIADMNAEKEKIELERSSWKEKNKKLWDQSIIVHRERDRIDKLKKEIESEHKQVIDSIFYAKRIQSALLPQNEQLRNLFKDIFIFWRPRDIVSGDFYWMRKIGEKIVVVVSDCTGHGVPGAFMSALGISFLNEIILHQHELSADSILESMRKLVKLSLHQTGAADEAKDGMDMSVCIYNKETSILEFAGANHSLLLYRKGEIIEFDGIHNPVGIYLKEKKFERQEIKVMEQDTFYMFTDGYLDEFGGESGHKFKKQNFRKLISEMNHGGLDMNSQYNKLATTMDNWLGDKYKQIDDILVVGFTL